MTSDPLNASVQVSIDLQEKEVHYVIQEDVLHLVRPCSANIDG